MKREHPQDFEQLGLQVGVLFFGDGADTFLERMKGEDNKTESPLD